jgi:hypothetical protein
MHPPARLLIEPVARLEADRNAVLATGVHDSLHTRAAGSARNDHALDGAPGFERRHHSVDSNQTVHGRDSGIL